MKCDKGLAFDYSMRLINHNIPPDLETNTKNVLYLGESENDNPAFRKSDISIGISSDKRLNPKLDCEYHIKYNYLSIF